MIVSCKRKTCKFQKADIFIGEICTHKNDNHMGVVWLDDKGKCISFVKYLKVYPRSK